MGTEPDAEGSQFAGSNALWRRAAAVPSPQFEDKTMAIDNPMEAHYWDGLTVQDFCKGIGVSESLHRTLHAIDKYNTEAVDVWIGGEWIGPDDSTARISSDCAIQKLRVRGIAWDGSDWEWCKEISGNDESSVVMANLSELREDFMDALADYEAERDADLAEDE